MQYEMNKNESKYFHTALLFDEALISLLEIKDLEYITVKEICNKAGVNRSTFYLHYETIDDLVLEAADYVNKKFITYFDHSTENFVDNIKTLSLEELKLVEKSHLTPYLHFIKDNKRIFKAAFHNPIGMRVYERYDKLKDHVILPIMERFEIDEKEQKYILVFYIEGMMAIIKKWVDDDCQDDIEDIENIMIKCVNKIEK